MGAHTWGVTMSDPHVIQYLTLTSVTHSFTRSFPKVRTGLT